MRRLTAEDIERRERTAVDPQTLVAAAEIVDTVRVEGESAVRFFGERFGDVSEEGALVIERPGLEDSLESLPAADRDLLERTAERIEVFASAQRRSLSEVTLEIDGGRAGQFIAPVGRAGCYAPGGRYPLPSSVLMTAVTAKVAGVESVVVASPRPALVTLAAAAAAGADAVLAVGGAHAVAAMAYGFEGFDACDVVVGPGNRWVTAAKQLVSSSVGIDILAGPSELVVLADETANAVTVAADLLAQAEHDPEALPVLVTTSEALAGAVEAELDRQLIDLPTRRVAGAALENGSIVLVPHIDAAVQVCDRLAPEHLQIMTREPEKLAAMVDHWGGLFIGGDSAEVLGDYGSGPNHTLPTGAVARYRGGLSVFDFLRIRTWLEIDDPGAARQLTEDAVALARLEGLEAHARAAELRLGKPRDN
ncbi:MAG: histidinol dehydrogenase [Acidobacteriota bacterium]|jgi:phosphoribosyl-ATP pyrophosphohydrolase/phosphoribosyl-AMP cyclohydrolase/histidinol dehydrogenase|nr:histidinol dehydrogenase [Acidobacteriota bacterium]